ncbi:gamma carbonic anhydrase family protein [Candidatus Micrarchaeota archaeon]|nr:gamma carbonic anhydrase family protein [Candidatus Micrarchaeota archaeon]
MLHEYKGKKPVIGNNCFVAESAQLVGDLELGDGSSVWFNAVVRADIAEIRIGKNVSIQDNCVLHATPGVPFSIGDDVAVGHNATVHSATIGRNVIIGMGAVLLTGSKIGDNCIIGAGSVVPEGKEIPDNSVAMGVPAKVVKQAKEEHHERIRKNVEEYVRLNADYLKK